MYILCNCGRKQKKELEEYQLSYSILKFLNYLGGFRELFFSEIYSLLCERKDQMRSSLRCVCVFVVFNIRTHDPRICTQNRHVCQCIHYVMKCDTTGNLIIKISILLCAPLFSIPWDLSR